MRRRGSPGPWIASGQFIAGGECITDARGEAVALVVSNWARDQNAALIAAAPFLYDALRALLAGVEDPHAMGVGASELQTARNALRAAGGFHG